MNQKKIFFFLVWLINGIISGIDIDLSSTEIDQKQKELTFNFQLAPHEKIIEASLTITSDSPHMTLSALVFSESAIKQYLPEYQDSKEIFNKDFSVQTVATCNVSTQTTANIHISYLLLPENKIGEKRFEVSWNALAQPESETKEVKKYPLTEQKKQQSYLESFQNQIQTSQNQWIRLLFAFLLGLLLSLTPCIYPMIPITIGVLHSRGKNSILYNLFGSICYASGLSTTFACFGLLAALAGASFGGLLAQPLFVLLITFFIGYMALSMIGIVNFPMFSFISHSSSLQSSRLNPFVSAFLFGLLSGSIASPCVSPGLALLLTVVATMGNIFAGFLLLFSFGIGMSVPLIIIGTFSTSLQMLPKAGPWMVEIKQAIGFVMLATCFYYLNNILPSSVIAWLFIGYLLFAALFYILSAQHSFDNQSKTIKSLIGILLLATAFFLGYTTYKSHKTETYQDQPKGVNWAPSYASALVQAKQEHKLLLLDFWAQHCTICKAIDKKIFQTNAVAQGLEKDIIFVKIDCSSHHNEEIKKLKQQYSIFGQPAILLINPEHESVIKQWSSELYNMTPQEFIMMIHSLKV
ncbi:sulfite exporter TauE/SafE family protein [Candidatus Dependentiae bacterium]|nr:sulfite exporter TauE/SafE family protein [Candidatus Dependentiae bacterium]